jgi:hypothetical protein
MKYRLTNENDADISVDVGTKVNIYFAGNDSAPVHLLDRHRGLVIYSSESAFAIMGHGLLLGEDATTYWAGPYSHMGSDYWSQSRTSSSGRDKGKPSSSASPSSQRPQSWSAPSA